MSIRLTARTAEIEADSLISLTERFRQRRCLRLSNWLEPRLAARALELTRRLAFEPDSNSVGIREICDEAVLRGFLMLLTNREPLFAFLERLSGRVPIRSFEGSVYRLMPGSGQHLDWHDDCPGERLLALSLGLSEQPYEGGEFQIRRKDETELLAAEPRLLLGEALIFDIDPGLEHRVTPVEGEHCRAAFAGWFLSSSLRTIGKPAPA